MISDLPDLLPVLEPPPRGWERLQARLHPPRARLPRWTIAAAAAAILLGALYLPGRHAAPARLAGVGDDPVMLALAAPRTEVVVLGHHAGGPVRLQGGVYVRLLALAPAADRPALDAQPPAP